MFNPTGRGPVAPARCEKVGAKNWLCCGSDDGAHWNATAVSLIASCQLHGIEPWAYLRDVLTLLPSWPATRVLAFSPKHWSETRQPEVVPMERDDEKYSVGVALIDRQRKELFATVND